jgi:hypothetical protein
MAARSRAADHARGKNERPRLLFSSGFVKNSRSWTVTTSGDRDETGIIDEAQVRSTGPVQRSIRGRSQRIHAS